MKTYVYIYYTNVSMCTRAQTYECIHILMFILLCVPTLNDVAFNEDTYSLCIHIHISTYVFIFNQFFLLNFGRL
jgi:hypothetical protein